MERLTIIRCSKLAFWLGAGAIVCAIVALATLNPFLFQFYLVITLATLLGLLALRWRAHAPLNCSWAVAATAMPLGFLAISMLLFVPACGLIGNADSRTQSSRSLKQIAGAMRDYQETHGFLPPASMIDSDGKPLLSWRVVILPFLGEESLYRQFHLDEPWDSQANAKLIEKMPSVYRASLQPGKSAQPYTTYYQVFVGPGTAFEPAKKLQIPRDFPDQPENVILVAEGSNPVPWTKPVDLPYDPHGPLPSLGFRGRDKGRFPWRGGEGVGSFLVATCDGGVRGVSWPGISEHTLRGAIVRNDGAQLGNDW